MIIVKAKVLNESKVVRITLTAISEAVLTVAVTAIVAVIDIDRGRVVGAGMAHRLFQRRHMS